MKQLLTYLLVITIVIFPVLAHAGSPVDTATSLVSKARIYSNLRNGDSSLHYAQLALADGKKRKDTALIVRSMALIGKANFYLKKTTDAANTYFDALKIARPGKDDDQIAFIYGEIGFVYFNTQHYKEAKEYYYKSLAIRKQLGQKKDIVSALINISVMSRQANDKGEAYTALRQAGNILATINDSALAGFFYNNLGVYHEYARQLDSARYYYLKAYDIWKAVNKVSEIYRTTFNIGYLAVERGNHKEALQYFKLAQSSAERYGSGTDIAHVYGTMAESFAATGSYKEAYQYLYKYAMLKDSLATGSFNGQLAELDKKYQTEKNKELIQEQQLKLKTANLQIQKQRSTILLVLLILVVAVAAAIIIFISYTFKRRLSDRVEEAKTRFFDNVVHEIRTPLSMIQAPISLLQSKIADPDLQQQLQLANRNIIRLNELVTQMLDVSKIDSATYKLNERLGDAAAIIQDITTAYQDTARQQAVTLTCHTQGATGLTYIDADALEKIMGNLLSNAFKFTPHGGKVEVALHCQPSLLTIQVSDSGPGIPNSDMPHIFNRFYRVEQHEKAGIKGVGIGLSLVKELVTLMSGTISVANQPTGGAIFTVALPLRQPQTQPAFTPVVDIPPASNSVDAAQADSNPDLKVILLVEDDKDILDFNANLLTQNGYHVLTATRVAQAEAILAKELPDLIITDLMMPDRDGMELVKSVRASASTNHIPIVVLSARRTAAIRVGTIDQGAQVYLPKPFMPDELLSTIKSQLAIIDNVRHKYQQQAAQPDTPVAEKFASTDPFTQRFFDLVQQHLDDAQLSVEKMADMMHMNRSHFQRKLKTLTGFSPSELIRSIRLEKALEMLRSKAGNVTEIAYATGFTSQSYFSKCFTEHFGYPPSQVS